jgi:hypothetical protein
MPESEWHKFIPRPDAFVYTIKFSGVPEVSELSPAEVAVIDEVFANFSGWDEWALVDYTHRLPEWRDPEGTSVQIPFEDILKGASVSRETIEAIADEADADRSMEAALARVR